DGILPGDRIARYAGAATDDRRAAAGKSWHRTSGIVTCAAPARTERSSDWGHVSAVATHSVAGCLIVTTMKWPGYVTFLAAAATAATAGCGGNFEPGSEELEDPTPQITANCDAAQLDDLVGKLRHVTSAVPMSCGDWVDGASKCYLVTMAQPIDHAAPESSKTFPQHVYVMHRGCDRPTVVADWGYANQYFYDDELSLLFQANAIWMEHRYQGQSVPEPDDWDWTQLTIENGARDMHRVIE